VKVIFLLIQGLVKIKRKQMKLSKMTIKKKRTIKKKKRLKKRKI
jgi:hypothetical protein